MATHPFSAENIPFGVFSLNGGKPTCCTRIEDNVISLHDLCQLELLDVSPDLLKTLLEVFSKPALNDFAALGTAAVNETRTAIQNVFKQSKNKEKLSKCSTPFEQAQMHMPMVVAEYTDFLTSKEHALNAAAIIFDGQPERINVPPSFFIAPIGYHGRASSVVVSGTPIKRPRNIAKDRQTGKIYYEPSRALDYEIELGFFLCKNNAQGEPVPIQSAEEHIFGAVLLNDWSARDHQGFEMTPLGPFNGKNFGTSISPWIVTLAALEKARSPLPPREDTIAPHLDAPNQTGIDLTIEATINGTKVSTTYSKYLYFSPGQLLAHHSVGGCPMRVGDLLATGTISGTESNALGSLMETSRGGKQPIQLDDGTKRGYLQDGDTVVFTAISSSGVGFGGCSGKLVAAK